MPLEKVEPTITPSPAIARIILKGATLEPIAELRKLAASLVTPTMRSEIASKNKMITKIR
jgi:hypothetical protein